MSIWYVSQKKNHSLYCTSFTFPMTNVTILGVFYTHAQKEYGNVLEIKSTYILNILALFSVFKCI